MTSVFFTYPLETIRIRMAYATHSAHSPPRAHAQLSFLSAMRQIYHEGPTALASPSSAPTTSSVFARLPILKFYRGFTVTLIGMIPYAGTSFLAWSLLRSHFLPAPAPSPSGSSSAPCPKSHPLTDLAIGALALSTTMSSLWIWTGERNVLAIRKKVFESIMHKDMAWFDCKMGMEDSAHADESDAPVGAGGLMANFAR